MIQTSQASRASQTAALAFALAAALHSGDAAADRFSRTHYVAPTGYCDAPLPVFDQYLRKSPRRITNEGPVEIYVSCSVPVDSVADRDRTNLWADFSSTLTQTIYVHCTAVVGSGAAGDYTYVTTSAPVSGGGRGWVQWQDLDKGPHDDAIVSFNCRLPPGISMTHITLVQYDEGSRL